MLASRITPAHSVDGSRVKSRVPAHRDGRRGWQITLADGRIGWFADGEHVTGTIGGPRNAIPAGPVKSTVRGGAQVGTLTYAERDGMKISRSLRELAREPKRSR